MRLDGKVALVTGGGTGIGRAIATRFASEGAKVAVAGRRKELCEQVVQEIQRNGGMASAFTFDVKNAPSVKDLVANVCKRYERLNTLVNNAGINLMRDLVDTTEEEWDNVLDTNLKGAFLCCKSAIPHMVRAGGGSIINIGSDLAIVGSPTRTVYCASKGGLVVLTRALALELAQYRIRVNCLCPAAVATPMLDEYLLAQRSPSRAERELSRIIPLGRIGVPEDAANAAVYLASNESSYVTGSVLMVDGGLTAR